MTHTTFAVRLLRSPAARLLALLCALVLAAWLGHHATQRRLGVLVPERIVAIDDFPELSGIAYLPGRGTLLGVGDNGEIAEITLEGKVLRKRMHAGRDFEDIALPAQPGHALATDAQHGLLLTISLADLAIVAERAVPAASIPTRRRSKRIEGLALAGQPPRLVLANERPPALVFLDGGPAAPRTLLLDADSLSGVTAGPQGELLLVSRDNGLRLLDADGRALGPWHPVAYHHLEGAALVPGVGLVLCADRKPGILLIFPSLRNWAALRHALAS